VRPGIAALAAALAASLAAGARAAERVEFTPIPDVDAAHVANPHDHQGKPLCQRCHVRGEERLSVNPVSLCAQCHDKARMKHPYDVAQPVAPADLPLEAGSRIVCHTCHDPHDVKARRSGLRLAYGELCLRCHRRHGEKAPAPAVK
jgi:predicted CXXCH cytochrome family protein